MRLQSGVSSNCDYENVGAVHARKAASSSCFGSLNTVGRRKTYLKSELFTYLWFGKYIINNMLLSKAEFFKTLDYYQSSGIAVEPFGLSRKKGVSPAEMSQVITVFGKTRPPPDPSAPRYLELLYIGDFELR